MSLFDFIIVGSGPAGTSAAFSLQKKNVLVLDVGHKPKQNGRSLDTNLSDLKKSKKDLFHSIIGKKFESLHNVDKNYLSPKLKAPLMKYVIQNRQYLSPVISENFDSVMSFAMGGLANAWGGGAYRFNDNDLKYFPISHVDLNPFYDKLTSLIGISGQVDDLDSYFGSAKGLLPPVKLNALGRDLYQRYKRHIRFFQRRNISIGYPRIAVLTRDYYDRKQYDYSGLEFFKPYLPSIYNPAFTMQILIDNDLVTYLPGRLVIKYKEEKKKVLVYVKNLGTNSLETYCGKKLLLCSGTLNTTKIVLHSANDYESRLPLLENPISYVPLINLSRIGCGLQKSSLPLQLNLIYDGPLSTEPIQASIYGMSATLWTDFLFDFPLSAKDCMNAVKYLMPSMLIIQLFYPDQKQERNYLKLEKNEKLRIHYEPHQQGLIEKHLVRSFSRIGYFGLSALCKYPAPGNSFHYAGSLPMKNEPGPNETDHNGRLHNHRHVFINDAANFTRLPSKNLTLTIMANSMRIADKLKWGSEQA